MTPLPSILPLAALLCPVAAAQPPQLLADITPGPASTWLGGVWRAGPALVFSATDASSGGTDLWRTDATPAGTWRAFAGGFQLVHAIGDRFLVFRGSAAGVADELHVFDARAAGGTLLRRFRWVDAEPGGALADRAVFVADDGVHGTEPWVSDGTPAGTHLLADLTPGATGPSPRLFHRVGQIVFFTLFNRASQQEELWSTDATSAGTQRVSAAMPWPAQTQLGPLFAAAGARLFVGIPATSTTPFELHLVDGRGGPLRAVARVPSPSGHATERLVPIGDSVLFTAEDASGVEPWISDGTTAGTRRLADLEPGSGSSSPAVFDSGVPSLLFARTGGRYHLFATDGTAAGTRAIHAQDLNYWWSPFGVFLIAGTDRVLFLDAPPAQPLADLWETDRTSAGTRVLLPGTTGLALHLGRLVYVHDDGAHGAEPWARPLGPIATEVGIGCGSEMRVPTLLANAPRLGGVLRLSGVQAPPSSLGLVVAGAVAAPPLRAGGGCVIETDPATSAILASVTPNGGAWQWSLALPVIPSLVGITIAAQAWFGPSANPLGIEASNGVHLTFGM